MPVTEDNEISAIMKRKKEILEEKLRSMNEIKKIKKDWSSINWLGFLNIIKVFDKLAHHKLVSELEYIIKDQRLINKKWKMIKVKIIFFEEQFQLVKNIFNISILSPFFFNMYLNPLDTNIAENHNKLDKKISNFLNYNF